MKFRIKYIKAKGYFPQVKHHWWKQWQQIRVINYSWGETIFKLVFKNDEDVIGSLPTKEKAITVTQEYMDSYIQQQLDNKATYIYL